MLTGSNTRSDRAQETDAEAEDPVGSPSQRATADREPESLPAQGRLGKVLLSLSAAGAPLIWLLVRRAGRRGGLAVSAGCGVLLIRDMTMVADGAPARLRTLPRILLLVEAATSAAATVAGLWAWVCRPFLVKPFEAGGVESIRPGAQQPGWHTALQRSRRVARAAESAALATFLLHTVRFAIYLGPDHGRRPPALADPDPQ